MSPSRIITATTSALLVLSLAACSDSDVCESNGDCFGGEVCRGGACMAVADVDGGNHGANNADPNNGGNHTSPDGGGDPDGTSDEDADESDDTGGNNNTGGPACVVDPFESECTDESFEPNDAWTDSEHLDANTAFGCLGGTIRELDETITSTLCALESADYYDFMYNTCRDSSYFIDLTFRPQLECTPELVRFELKNHSCDDENVNCEDLADGGKRIRLIVESTQHQEQGRAAYFLVEPADPDEKVNVPYEIEARLYK